MEGLIPCDVADSQIGEITTSLVLPEDWLDQTLSRFNLQTEVDRVMTRRKEIEGRLKRLDQAYVDGLFADGDYYRYQKRTLELELESLIIPEVDSIKEPGHLVMDLPRLWGGATIEERLLLLLAMLGAVYVDTKGRRAIVSIKPKAAFHALFEVANAPLLTSDSWPTVGSKRVLRPSL